SVRILQGVDHVKTTDRKRPSDRDGLQFLRWHVYLPSEILASFTFADEFVSICDGGWPKESLPVSLADQCSSCRMISADPRMNLFVQSPSVLLGDASHDYAGSSFALEVC